jgi:DNA-directed RNA polymerase specialized sigma24 family protein
MSTTAQSAQTTLQDFGEGRAVRRKLKQLEEPYRDAQVLRYLYWDCAMSLRQIGSKLGVGDEIVRKWMQHHGIERRDRVEAAQLRKLRDGPFRGESNDSMDSGEADSSTESKWSFQD